MMLEFISQSTGSPTSYPAGHSKPSLDSDVEGFGIFPAEPIFPLNNMLVEGFFPKAYCRHNKVKSNLSFMG